MERAAIVPVLMITIAQRMRFFTVEAEIGDSVGSSSNAGPITGSNGEFPTIFYNNLGGSSKNTLIF